MDGLSGRGRLTSNAGACSMIPQSLCLATVLPFTLKYEGGYANVVGDKGGETYRGITRKNNPTWRGWPMVDKAKPLKRNQMVKEAEPAVLEFYWNRFKGLSLDKLNSTKVALAMFDYNVHGGFSGTVMRTIVLQKWGKALTPETMIAWINANDENAICTAILDHRTAYLKKLAENPTQTKFKAGWLTRIESMKAYMKLKPLLGISAGLVFLLIAIFFFYLKAKGAKNVQY